MPEDAAPVFAALADRTRLQILSWLETGQARTPTEFADRLPISRQAISKHLGVLSGAELVLADRRGREVRYRLNPEGLDQATRWLIRRSEMWRSRLEALARHVEAGEA